MTTTPAWHCSRKDCGNKAAVFPQLFMWAVGWQGRDTRNAIGPMFALPICTPCSEKIGPDDLLTDEGFDSIVAGVVEAGRAVPDRKSAVLKFHRLEDFRKVAPIARFNLPTPDWIEGDVSS